jgi:O-antigen/teichoic acid export membrane protein
MSNIRRQSILSTLVIYIGFAIGLLNTYLFTRKGSFPDLHQFGLYNAFIAIATIMMAFSNLGITTFISKFFPYYKHHLKDEENDILGISVIINSIGIGLLLITGYVIKPMVVRKYSGNAPEIDQYYQWIFPLAIGLLIFNILEAYSWQLRKSVLTNFLREGVWRLFTTVLILLYLSGIMSSFDTFIKCFAFSYPFIALTLLTYLIFTKQIHINFSYSKVTKRFKRTIYKLCSFVYAGSLLFTVAQMFDSLVIPSVLTDGLAMLAVYSLAQSLVAMIQAPQRGIVAASMGPLSKAWREKDLVLIQKIYHRSSINQLLFALTLFGLLWLNYFNAVETLQLKESYKLAFTVILLLGSTKIIDMGTGINSQIIATSSYWRFELTSGIILILIMLPVTYLLTKEFGINGTATAQLISIGIYNTIRLIFLWKKFKLQPFKLTTLLAFLWGLLVMATTYFLFDTQMGWFGLISRSCFFVLVFAIGTIYFRFSPDVEPVWATLKKRLGLTSKN